MHGIKERATLIAIGLSLLVAGYCGLSAKAGEPLRLGRNQGGTQTLPVLAVAEKYFDAAGVDIELVEFLSTTDGINALNVGKIDVGLSFGVGSPLTYASKGAPIVIIAGNLGGGHPVIARPEDAGLYKSVRDFKGKTVGTPRMYTADVVFRGAIFQAGLEPDRDLTVIEFKRPIDVLESLKSGKIDVGIGSSSITARALAAGLSIPLWSNDLFTYHPCCRIITTREVLEKRRPELVKVLKALLLAEKKFVEDPEAAVRTNMADQKLDEDVVRSLTLDPHVQLEVDPNTRGIIKMWEYMKASRYIESDMNPRDFINTSLYQEALASLKAERPSPFWEKLEARFREWNE